jgi:hypothetical protein
MFGSEDMPAYWDLRPDRRVGARLLSDFGSLTDRQGQLQICRSDRQAVCLCIAALVANLLICRVQLVGAMVNTWPPGIMK